VKRQPGFYWIRLVRKHVTIARWTGREWMLPSGRYTDTRVRKVLSERLTLPNGWGR
jgi:hypothetical protein